MRLFEAAKSVNIVKIYNKISQVPAKTSPKGGTAHCPFHDDKNPSLSLYTDNNTFKCFGCGKHGTAIDLVMEMKKVDNRTAAEWICKEFDVAYDDIPSACGCGEKEDEPAVDVFLSSYESTAKYFHACLEKSPDPKFFEKRGVGSLSEEFRFGYCPEGIIFTKKVELAQKLKLSNDKGECVFGGRYIVPLTNYRNQVIGFIGRLPDNKVDENHPKYLISENSPIFKKRSFFFNSPALLDRETKKILVVEGVFDALSYIVAGVRNVVSPLGNSLSDTHLNTLRSRLDRDVVIAFDRDDAGEKATLKVTEYARNLRIAILTADFKGQKDANALLLAQGKEFLAKTAEQVLLAPDYLLAFYKKNGLIDTRQGRSDLNVKLAKAIGYTTLPLAEQYPMNKAYAPVDVEDWWNAFKYLIKKKRLLKI